MKAVEVRSAAHENIKTEEESRDFHARGGTSTPQNEERKKLSEKSHNEEALGGKTDGHTRVVSCL